MRRLAMIAIGLLLASAVVYPAQAATPLTLVTTQTELSNDFYPVSAQARCPAHTVVYGGGADLTGLSPLVTDIFLRSASPYVTSDGTSSGFIGAASNTRIPLGPGSHEWGLTVTALCGPKLPGYEVKSATSAAGSSATRSVAVGCSAGRVPLATGATVRGSDRYERRFALFGTSISSDPAVNTVAAAAAETTAGDPADWDLIATVVCATKPPGWTKIVKNGAADTAGYKGANTVACPIGTRVFGGGGIIGSQVPGDAHLLQFATIRTTRRQSVTAAWAHPTKPWFASASTFCAI